MINKSLLALKECLRGLHTQQHTGAKQKMPFRDSSITRLLEEVLVPKRGKDSDTVMLVNCAQPAQLEKKTVNSLRYGQLYATTTSGGGAGREDDEGVRPIRRAARVHDHLQPQLRRRARLHLQCKVEQRDSPDRPAGRRRGGLHAAVQLHARVRRVEDCRRRQRRGLPPLSPMHVGRARHTAARALPPRQLQFCPRAPPA